MFFKLIFTGIALFLASNLYRLAHNYILARRIGLPIVVCPATWQNPFWLLVVTSFPFVRQLSHVPGLGWIRYSYIGWVFFDTYHAHDRHGPAFTIVSPAKNEIMLGDPRVIQDVMSRYKKWLKPRELYGVFSLLGENVNSANADEWQKHRRVINAGFAEGNMNIVWDSSAKQARQWMKEQTINLRQLNADTDTISANVLMRAGFGKSYEFNEKGLKDLKPGHKKSLAGGMQFMLSNFLFAWGVKDIRLPAFIEPKKIKELRETLVELKSYLGDIIQNRSGEFVEALIEANENEKADGRGHLTQDELYGNLFILQLAGFDTTSYAMSFTLSLLSTHPKVQDWVREEIVSGGYEESYPKAIRCRAVMMETLRLFTPAPSLPRYSPLTETLRIAEKDYVLPPNTMVSSNFPGIHTDPKIWGQDAGVWKPQRWVEVVDGAEVLNERWEMMSWATGPRVCPGRKFSQVETVAALTAVLKDYRLEGTTNIEDLLRDFEFNLTPKPKKPEAGSIKFVKIYNSKY